MTAIVFLGLTGLVLYPLVEGNRRWMRFQIAFIPAFFAYAIVWSAAWFALRFGPGEWIGSLAGSAVFAGWVSWRLGSPRAALVGGPILFVTHSIGYFLGGWTTAWLSKETTEETLTFLTPSQLAAVAKLSWGLFYGIGFGAGIGAVFYLAQKPKATASS